jgi:hypothetical protein
MSSGIAIFSGEDLERGLIAVAVAGRLSAERVLSVLSSAGEADIISLRVVRAYLEGQRDALTSLAALFGLPELEVDMVLAKYYGHRPAKGGE